MVELQTLPQKVTFKIGYTPLDSSTDPYTQTSLLLIFSVRIYTESQVLCSCARNVKVIKAFQAS